MVKSHLIIHIVQIIGVFFCAHHLWPKGVTYGEQEEWEKEHRKRQHSHGHRSRSKSKNKRGYESPVYEEASSPERPERGQRVRRRDRVNRDYEIEYREPPRHREIEYDDRPEFSRRASSRY